MRSRGRAINEAPSASRTAFQRDRDRIIHSTAFRRLALKTQVFLPNEGDHYRTRLTHTIEVAQITRTLTRALGLDDDLGEALALAHDFGHTPFGHTGETALDEVLETFGGFDHNAQTLRVVTLLERRYSDFFGLNLTWETIDGLLKRGGRRPDQHHQPWFRGDLQCFDPESPWARAFDDGLQPSAEAQVAAVADDIAYNAHDLEDGLDAGLFTLADLDEVPVLAATKRALVEAHPGIAEDLLVRGMARQVVGRFVEDVIAESRRRLAVVGARSVDDIRGEAVPMVGLSLELAEDSEQLKRFLFARMYRHPRLLHLRMKSRQTVLELALALLDDPRLLPSEWQDPAVGRGTVQHARRVADYVAGMTDRFAAAEHRRLFDGTRELG